MHAVKNDTQVFYHFLEAEWTALNFDQLLMSRQSKFEINTRARYKIGTNIPTKRLELI